MTTNHKLFQRTHPFDSVASRDAQRPVVRFSPKDRKLSDVRVIEDTPGALKVEVAMANGPATILWLSKKCCRRAGDNIWVDSWLIEKEGLQYVP